MNSNAISAMENLMSILEVRPNGKNYFARPAKVIRYIRYSLSLECPQEVTEMPIQAAAAAAALLLRAPDVVNTGSKSRIINSQRQLLSHFCRGEHKARPYKKHHRARLQPCFSV